MTECKAPPLKRIAMLDVARFYGMILVYYGHIIERIMYLENPTAAMHYKFIYSFHMPFFFLLSGFVANPDKVHEPARHFARRMALSRLVPYVFFCLVLALSTLIWEGHFVAVDLSSAKGYLEGTIATALGFPVFNIPLWFLACLITVEVLHRLLAPIVCKDWGLIVTALLFYSGGVWLNREFSFLMEGVNFWFLNEAPVVYAFYLVGVFMRRHGMLLGVTSRPWTFTAGVALLLVVVFSFDANQGPFRMFDAVVIVLGAHGHMLLFPLTAIAGALALLLLGHASGESRWLGYMGRNAIILFSLNGIFYHYFNGPFADWYMETFSGGPWSVFLAGSAMTVLSMAACLPLVWLLDRFFPQLVGRPAEHGPILPRLMKHHEERGASAQRL